MMKWSPWMGGGTGETKKLHVKLKQLKVEMVCKEKVEDDHKRDQKIVMVEIKWRSGPKAGVLVPFYRTPTYQRNYTHQRCLRRRKSVEWDDEFESLCNFSVSKDGSLGPWNVTFNVLYGESKESRSKLAVLGKASLNLAELASKMETRIERKLPITLHDGRFAREATLSVSVTFAEVRDSYDSSRIGLNSAESNTKNASRRKVKDLTSLKKKQKPEVRSSIDSDKFTVFDWQGSSGSITSSDNCNVAESGSFPSSETRLDPVRKTGFFSWKRRRLSLRASKGRVEPVTSGPLRKGDATGLSSLAPNPQQFVARIVNNPSSKYERASMGHTYSNKWVNYSRSARISGSYNDSITFAARIINNPNSKIDRNFYPSSELDTKDCRTTSNWEVKELVSRDGKAKLKTSVFFASFDQMSERAAGESACTALVTVIAHRLHSNQEIPTRPEFDSLIIEGSSEWQKLCRNDTYIQSFPDKHFDLDTVLEANLRPLSVLPDKSFIGFFCPEKFECLKEAMSFDAIWNKIINNQPSIYIVSWNDHFFVLKVDADAYYIIDSLGERLFEGCNQAYMLKFDDSSLMYETSSSVEKAEKEESDHQEIICIGRECCKEFIKRFLAAIPLRELEEEKEKGSISNHLYQRLQIEFHLCSSAYSVTPRSRIEKTKSGPHRVRNVQRYL